MRQPQLYQEARGERFGRPPYSEARRYPPPVDADTPHNVARRRRVLTETTDEEDR